MTKITNSVTPWPGGDAIKSFQWLDAFLQEQAGTEIEFQPAWQAYKYMLRGKMYAFIGINDQNGHSVLTLKLEPLYSDLLRSEYEDIVPGYYMNKLHWSTVYLDGDVPQAVLADMMHASYNVMLLSLSKKARQEILEG